MITLKFNNKKIDNLSINGTNFVSENKIDTSIFPSYPFTLKVEEDGDELYTLNNAELIQQQQYDDEWYICFREVTEQELKYQDLLGKIEYLAIMTGNEVNIK